MQRCVCHGLYSSSADGKLSEHDLSTSRGTQRTSVRTTPCVPQGVPPERRMIRGMNLLLDIGGEGRYADAVNINTRRYNTLEPGRGEPIPRLIVARADAIPLARGSVARIVVERTPLTAAALAEIARVIAPQGMIVLRHVPLERGDRHGRARDYLGGRAERRTLRLAGQWVQETRIQVA